MGFLIYYFRTKFLENYVEGVSRRMPPSCMQPLSRLPGTSPSVLGPAWVWPPPLHLAVPPAPSDGCSWGSVRLLSCVGSSSSWQTQAQGCTCGTETSQMDHSITDKGKSWFSHTWGSIDFLRFAFPSFTFRRSARETTNPLQLFLLP